jgi:xanthine dehydrogenase accessory factor
MEPFLPVPELFVFGGGHVGGEIGRLASNVGFSVTIIDDRPTFADEHRHPDVDRCLVATVDEVFSRFVFDEYSYVVAATRGHQHDEIVVEAAMRTRARYIGMLGSERKKVVLWKRLLERGAPEERLAQVYAPIGLNIGADNPPEIAVSVVAELIELRRGVKKVWKTKTPRAAG